MEYLLVRLCCVADEAADQKKFFKVKYFFGDLSYGAKIQSDAYFKNYMDLCMLQFLGAFSWIQETFSSFTIVFEDITLNIFSVCYILLAFPPHNQRKRIEIEGTKLESK